jgi:hypothetical protein
MVQFMKFANWHHLESENIDGMRGGRMVVVWVVALLVVPSYGLDNGVAITPPMGFNSYMAGLNGGGKWWLHLGSDYLVDHSSWTTV